jgi:hypothetical protein
LLTIGSPPSVFILTAPLAAPRILNIGPERAKMAIEVWRIDVSAIQVRNGLIVHKDAGTTGCAPAIVAVTDWGMPLGQILDHSHMVPSSRYRATSPYSLIAQSRHFCRRFPRSGAMPIFPSHIIFPFTDYLGNAPKRAPEHGPGTPMRAHGAHRRA